MEGRCPSFRPYGGGVIGSLVGAYDAGKALDKRVTKTASKTAVRQTHLEGLDSGLAPGADETDHRARRMGNSAAYSMVRSLSRAAHFNSVLTLCSSRP